MGEADLVEAQLHNIMELQDGKEVNPPQLANLTNQPTVPQQKIYKCWLRICIYVVFVLSGQSAAALLGSLYYRKGGKSNWMATLVQPAGFPVLLPLYLLSPSNNPTARSTDTKSPSNSVLAAVYVSLGTIVAAYCMLFSRGLLYLPVSTFSLICASQLGFTALFSFFLNSQKLTPFISNSLVLLTISSTLLVFQDDSTESKQVSRGKYVLGFICTVLASALNGLSVSLVQLAFKKVLKQETFKAVLNMIFYPSLVSTSAILAGFFVSGDWKGLSREMEEFELGKVSYFMTLIWIAISGQVLSIGSVGLVYEVSSLFSNVIGTMGLPVVPVLAVIFFHDKMNGIKLISLVLAIWGFVSYAYQHYLENRKSKTENTAPAV